MTFLSSQSAQSPSRECETSLIFPMANPYECCQHNGRVMDAMIVTSSISSLCVPEVQMSCGTRLPFTGQYWHYNRHLLWGGDSTLCLVCCFGHVTYTTNYKVDPKRYISYPDDSFPSQHRPDV